MANNVLADGSRGPQHLCGTCKQSNDSRLFFDKKLRFLLKQCLNSTTFVSSWRGQSAVLQLVNHGRVKKSSMTLLLLITDIKNV